MKRCLLILALCGSVHAQDYLKGPVIDFWGTANDPQAQQWRRQAEAFSESVRQDDINRRLKEIEERQEEILRRERCR